MTSTFKSIVPPMVTYDRDTDSIVFGRSALKAMKAERWITIHSDREGGGTHVKIDDKGNITAGPAGLAERGIRNLSDFGKGKEGGDKPKAKPEGKLTGTSSEILQKHAGSVMDAVNRHLDKGNELRFMAGKYVHDVTPEDRGAIRVRGGNIQVQHRGKWSAMGANDVDALAQRVGHPTRMQSLENSTDIESSIEEAKREAEQATADREKYDAFVDRHFAGNRNAANADFDASGFADKDHDKWVQQVESRAASQPPSTQADQGEGKGNDSSGKVITPEIREAAKRANMTPEAMAAHREKLSAMASDYDAKRGFTMTDRTPEGYGPTGNSEGGQSSSPHDYHQSTEEMNKRNSINEAKVILRGKISGDKRDALERSLTKMEKELADMPKASDQRPLSASEIDRDVSTAPSKKPGVPGMQTSLFDDDASGQGQLFNYVPPKKGDNKPKKTAGDASLLEKIEDDQKEHEQSRAALRGQRDMFGGAKSLTAFKRWITIHPHGKDKKGIHIEIDGDGNITKGPRHLAENGIHHVGDFGNPKRPSEEHVEEMIPHAHRWLTEQHEQREAAKRDARRYTGMNAGNLSWRENRDGRDFSSINGFDRAARQFAEENAHYGFDKDDHDTPAKVWELIREGKKKPPTMDDPEVRKIAEHWATQSRGRQRQPKVVLNAEGGEDF